MVGRVVLAVPVADAEVLDALRHEADEVVCLQDHLAWGAIGPAYEDFRQISDAEVTSLLARFAPTPGPAPGGYSASR